ncbi:MAG: hypothetical protein V1495_03305 [Pseudomonadota bacterium]
MKRTASVLLNLLTATLLAACSSSPDPKELTVSYRSRIRLPHDGEFLSAEKFKAQVEKMDPIKDFRCSAEGSDAFQTVTEFLGGISWGHPVAIIKDESLPPLYQHKKKFEPLYASANNADGASAPTIERPDLVGIQDGVAIFLSKAHGLIAVDITGAAPVVSCALKLPGDPRNFFFKGNEIILLVNGKNTTRPNRSALLRFRFANKQFSFVDSLTFEDQTLTDARLFDRVVVVYTALHQPQTIAGGTTTMMIAGDPRYGTPYETLGVKLQAIKWDSGLSVDWEETFLNDPEESDPLMGRDPSPLKPGDVVYTEKHYKGFISASDAYLVVTKDVRRTIFDHMESQTYGICTSYNPKHHQVQQCYGVFEQRKNPDYVPPNPTTGDYSCNGKKLADCIQEAAPKVSQYIYVKTGQKCEMVWVGMCENYEWKTVTYPRYRTDTQSEFSVYRFVDGSFTKLDDTLFALNSPAAADPASLVFTGKPLALPGTVENKDGLQFQNGHFYVVTRTGMHALLIVGNSIALTNTTPLSLAGGDFTGGFSVSFSPGQTMISATKNLWNSSIPTRSQIVTAGLDDPSFPKIRNNYEMPGANTQLILADSGFLGPGSVSFESGGVKRNLEKLTLYSQADGSERDNLLLGTEYDTLENSWFSSADDQRIRLHQPSQRLFLPYSGKHHAEPTDPNVHRLNITAVGDGRLTSERSFEVAEEIIRTASIDSNKALVFGQSSVYAVDRTSGEWGIQTVREFFVPIATYRVTDADIYARVDRLGNQCKILTFSGSEAVFGGEPLAQSMTLCGDGLPVGVRNNLVFRDTLTGWSISKNGRKLSDLSKDDAQKLLDETKRGDYCALDETEDYGTPVEYLDAVPPRLFCYEIPQKPEPMAPQTP